MERSCAMNIGVLVSGGGTNLQNIIDRIEDGYLEGCRITTVVSSNPDAYALKRAEKHGIPRAVISKRDFATEEEFDDALIRHMEEHGVELVVMAGYLVKTGEKFCNHFRGRIINIHPSLIPAFCGKGYYGIIPHREALKYGVKITGATVHFVEHEYDSGPIILQKAVYVRDDDTPETLQKRVMEEAERELLPEAIRLFAKGRLALEGRKVRILVDEHTNAD